MARRQVSIFINGKKVAKEIGILRAEKRKLQRALNKMTIGSEDYMNTMKELNKLNPIINKHRKQLNGISSTLDKVKKSSTFDSLKSGAATLAGAAGIGGVVISAQMAADAVQEVVKNTNRLRREITQLTGAGGDELDNLTVRISAVSRTFEKEQREVLQATNTLVKEFGISYDTALDQISEGFILGADNSGDFLENIKEYSTQFKEAGFSAEDFIRISVRSQREGVFSDKGLDAVKEFGLRIREQTTATTDAMRAAFGKKFTDEIFSGINDGSIKAADALERVATEMNDLSIPTAQLQTVIADVFGGPGEDAGLRYLQSLHNIQEETIYTTEETEKYIEAQRELLAANTELSIAENKLAEQLQTTGDRFNILWTNIKTAGLTALSAILTSIQEFPTKIKATLAAIKQPFKNLFGDPEDAKSATKAYYDVVFEEAEKNEARSRAIRDQAAKEEELRKQKADEEAMKRRAERMQRATEQELKALQDRQRRLSEAVQKFQEDQELKQLSAEDQKLEKIRRQFQKQIDIAKELEAKGVEEATAQRLELERLKEVALREELDRQFLARQTKLDEQATQELLAEIERRAVQEAAKAAAEQEIRAGLRQYILSEQDQALADLEAHFFKLTELAKKNGIDTLDIEITYRKQRQELLDKFEKEDQEKFIAGQKAKATALAEAFSGMASAVQGALDLATAAGIENTAAGKLLAIAQIGISSAAAIAQATAASSGVPFPGNLVAIATAVGTVLSNIGRAKKIIDGVDVPQKFMGGFTEVRGATDGKTYNARYIGDQPTGMLDYNSPVLTGSGILANEKGPEYFVASHDVKKPAVLNHIRAIENITGARQFMGGGATAPLPTGESSPGMPAEIMGLLVNINSTLQMIQATPRQPLIGDDEITKLNNRQSRLLKASGRS